MNKVLFSSMKCNWHTPKELYSSLNTEFHFNHDPCPEGAIFGIEQEWGSSTYCNPPYGRAVLEWIQKGVDEAKRGKTIVFLLPSRTDTKWFHDLILPHAKEIRFIRGRLHFSDKGPAPFPSMIVIL